IPHQRWGRSYPMLPAKVHPRPNRPRPRPGAAASIAKSPSPGRRPAGFPSRCALMIALVTLEESLNHAQAATLLRWVLRSRDRDEFLRLVTALDKGRAIERMRGAAFAYQSRRPALAAAA
ncbi:MAG TPA: hypothetical protein VGZ47_21600, partial [Gemmataceae bacterium]|nr:hypothetical protein [Gemmataceae bacterium]